MALKTKFRRVATRINPDPAGGNTMNVTFQIQAGDPMFDSEAEALQSIANGHPTDILWAIIPQYQSVPSIESENTEV